MTSAAYSDLHGRLGEVRLLAQLDPWRNGDTSQPAVTNAVNRACLVLLSAHFEGYLEDLAVVAMDFLVGQAIVVERLPLLLRALHTEDHLRVLESMTDAKARAPRILNMHRQESPLWSAGTALAAPMLRQKLVCGEMNNPGSKEVRQFLELLDVDIETHLNAVGNPSILGRINGLVGRRNAVAHGEVSATATFTDIDDYLVLVGDLARHIDDATALSVKQICGLTMLPW